MLQTNSSEISHKNAASTIRHKMPQKLNKYNPPQKSIAYRGGDQMKVTENDCLKSRLSNILKSENSLH